MSQWLFSIFKSKSTRKTRIWELRKLKPFKVTIGRCRRRGRYAYYYRKTKLNWTLIWVQTYWAFSLVAFTRQVDRIEPKVNACHFKIMSLCPYVDFFSKLFHAKQGWKKNKIQIWTIHCVQSERKRKLLKELTRPMTMDNAYNFRWEVRFAFRFESFFRIDQWLTRRLAHFSFYLFSKIDCIEFEIIIDKHILQMTQKGTDRLLKKIENVPSQTIIDNFRRVQRFNITFDWSCFFKASNSKNKFLFKYILH